MASSLQPSHWETARLLARLAEIAYQADRELAADALRATCDVIEFLDGCRGFVARTNREIVVAFAGTSNLGDWSVNLSSQLVPGYGGHVHKGFAILTEALWSAVHAAILKLRDSEQPIRLTGHSLGGAVALLTGLRLQEAGLPVAGVFTFGMPKVGDEVFASACKLPCWRFETAGDPVPHLPLVGKRERTATDQTDDVFLYHAVGTIVDLREPHHGDRVMPGLIGFLIDRFTQYRQSQGTDQHHPIAYYLKCMEQGKSEV